MNRRFHFLLLAALGLPAFAALGANAAEPSATQPRGGRVGWARLITPSRNWDVHSDHDSTVAEFIRTQTNLNMDPTCYPADPAKLDQLCLYPLIFTNDLTPIRNQQQWANLGEYLKRGGFLYVDACANLAITGDFKVFYRRHVEIFSRLFPGSAVRPLPKSHEIYQIYFAINQELLYGRRYGGNSDPNELYGVYDGDRLIGIISFSTVLCGWPQKPQRIPEALKMIVNLYVYAMAR